MGRLARYLGRRLESPSDLSAERAQLTAAAQTLTATADNLATTNQALIEFHTRRRSRLGTLVLLVITASTAAVLVLATLGAYNSATAASKATDIIAEARFLEEGFQDVIYVRLAQGLPQETLDEILRRNQQYIDETRAAREAASETAKSALRDQPFWLALIALSGALLGALLGEVVSTFTGAGRPRPDVKPRAKS